MRSRHCSFKWNAACSCCRSGSWSILVIAHHGPYLFILGKGHDGKVQLWDLESNRWSMGPKLVQRNAYTHVATSMATSLVLLGSPEMQNSVLTCPTSKIDCQWQLEVNASPNIVGHDHQYAWKHTNLLCAHLCLTWVALGCRDLRLMYQTHFSNVKDLKFTMSTVEDQRQFSSYSRRVLRTRASVLAWDK